MEQSSKALSETLKDQSRLLFQFWRLLDRTRAVDGVELAIARARRPAQFHAPPTNWRKIWSDGSAHTYPITCYLAWLWRLRPDCCGIGVGVEPPPYVERQIARDAQYHPVFTHGDLLWRDRRNLLGATYNGLEIGRWSGLYAIVFPAGALFGHCGFLIFVYQHYS